MRRNILFGSVLAAALSVGVAAQSGSTSPQNPSATAESRTEQMLTVTGCLQASDELSATGTSGSATAKTADASDADHFILKNVEQGSSSSMASSSSAAREGSSARSTTGSAQSEASATRGTSGSSTMGTPTTQYQLAGGDKDQLRRYANSKVEIQGRIDTHANAGNSPQTPAGVDKGTTGSTMSGGNRMPQTNSAIETLRIESIRQIAASCNP